MTEPDAASSSHSPAAPTAPVGVLITKWISLRIPVGALRIRHTEAGIVMDPVQVEVTLDTWPHWLELALRHSQAANQAHRRLLTAHSAGDMHARGNALNDELQSSMQAICAATFAVDALFGLLCDVNPPPAPLREMWNSARTTRPQRVLEQIRRCSILSNRQTQALRKPLRTAFQFRNWAVHPPREFRQPMLHPDLNVGAEWRYLCFSSVNAHNAISLAIETLTYAFERPRYATTGTEWAAQGASLLRQLLAEIGVTVQMRS